MLELSLGLSFAAFGLALLSLVVSVSQAAKRSSMRMPVAPEETVGLMFGIPTEEGEIEQLNFIPCTCGTDAYTCRIHQAARC